MSYSFCFCGVLDDLDVNGYCRTCSAAPHHRECPCDECEAYWMGVENRTKLAAQQRRVERSVPAPSEGGEQ